LAGELRPVSRPEARVREAIRMGFRRIVLPRGNLERAQKGVRASPPPVWVAAATLAEAWRALSAAQGSPSG
ncbi:MAG: DNA repair protein RadA, partial [Zetaproteobacteria bacterium]